MSKMKTSAALLGVKFRAGDGAVKAEATGAISGYGSVFDVVDSYDEIVVRGAFAESLRQQRSVPILWEHDRAQPIGLWSVLAEDEYGLRCAGRLLVDEVQKAREASALLRERAVTGLSIGYRVRKSSFDEKTGIRTLTALDLMEISLVTFPANDQARADAVKAAARGEVPDEEAFIEFLIEHDFRKSLAVDIARHGIAGLKRRSGGDDLAELGAALSGFSLPKL